MCEQLLSAGAGGHIQAEAPAGQIVHQVLVKRDLSEHCRGSDFMARAHSSLDENFRFSKTDSKYNMGSVIVWRKNVPCDILNIF